MDMDSDIRIEIDGWKCNQIYDLNLYLNRSDHVDVLSLKETDALLNWFESFVNSKRSNDPVFRKREELTDIKRVHQIELKSLLEEVHAAKARYSLNPEHDVVESLLECIRKTENAKKGILQFLEANKIAEVDEDKREMSYLDARLSEKVIRSRIRFVETSQTLSELHVKLQVVIQRVPEWQALQKAEMALSDFEDSIGLNEQRSELIILAKERGSASQSSGRKLEDVCSDLLNVIIANSHFFSLQEGESAYVLSNVTLGMALGEIDKMVVAVHPDNPEVKVKLLMECKQNANDIGRSFGIYQRMLTWLTGDQSNYIASEWRTQKFTKGHFDRVAVHEEASRKYHIGPSSFSEFQRAEGGYFLEGLLFATNITRYSSSRLTGLDSQSVQTLAYRISSDVDFKARFAARDVSYLSALLTAGTKGSGEAALSTAQVLNLYRRNGCLAKNVFLMQRVS